MARFATTRWSLILDAREPRSSRRALEEICRTYRTPVLAYVCRHGYSRTDAEDLTQEFFTRFLEGRWDAVADPARGHFRAYLLVAIRRFLISADEAANTLKRGGGVRRIAGDDELERLEAPHGESPERVFQRTWAMTVLDRSYARLRDEAHRAGRQQLFEQLSPYLAERPAVDDYQRMSNALGMRANTIAVAVHRLRARLRELVREEVADTCSSPEEVEAELHDLRDTLKHIDD
ncbi:RNA polymerase sigma factor [Lysobacter solisilvae (ex Woo and Kim 2020)]|uniref:Sigma-70 family RNA polymerase sigma factor n=1 Tax=Agrilutibacter terrestris TaxID=2865112 RepID=A0A7H0FUV7_9GAMM|nr:sigma-70 family RNA polymerase sigma factor [Lysobacter terrestris]QNP39823.1 sigma-70 family RNA polymerase sigma factor [Lysobacter terrestris]